MKVYTIHEIQQVYKQHSDCPHSVVYSKDKGYTWQSVPVDSGKWNIKNWIFAFIE